MTDAPMNPHKVKALELAVQAGGDSQAIVARATAFLGFLVSNAASAGGAAAPKPAAAPAAGAAAPKPAAAAGAKAPAAAGAKAPAAAGAKAPAAAGAKPAAAKPAAAKPDAKAGASAAPIPPDTKAPGGTFTYGDVVNKLREVQAAEGLGREKAFAILASAGGKAASVRDLKPANYDAVVKAATAALNPAAAEEDALGDPPEQTSGGLGADEDPTQGPAADDFDV